MGTGEGHREATPPPENQIFFYLKKLKIQHVLYMNYPNLVASVWIGIRTNSSRELFARTIRANNSRQCETGINDELRVSVHLSVTS